MVAWRRLGTVVASLLILSALSIVWNTSNDTLVDVVPDAPPTVTSVVTTQETTFEPASRQSDDVTAEDSPSSCVFYESPRELRLLSRESAGKQHCPAKDPDCLQWARFPSSVDNADGASCDFLCTQSSESRPAVWKQSMIRSHAIVDIPTAVGLNDDDTSHRNACSLLVSPVQCLLGGGPSRHISLLLIGHSHTRFLASMLCMMLNATSCQRLDDQFRNISVVREADIVYPSKQQGLTHRPPSNFIRIAFVQSNYHYGAKVRLMQSTFTKTELASFTHVIYSRGSWDLLFYDRAPNTIADDLRSSLLELYSVLSPTVRRVIHLHHYVHYKPDGGSGNKKKGPSHAAIRAAWRRNCFASSRVEQVRDATLCGSWDEEATSKGHAVSVYDTYTETRTPLGFQFADILGHHYQDVMLEYLAMKFLREHVCPPVGAPLPKTLQLSANRASAACKRTEVATSAFHVSTECACHHPTERRDHICKRFGRSVPDVARRG